MDLANQILNYLNIFYNAFISNQAYETGSAIYMSNQMSIANVSIFKCIFQNNIILTKMALFGSTIHLEDPGNITINDTKFIQNKGVLGACIYFAESSKDDCSMQLSNNLFIENRATLGGGVLYLKNTFESFFEISNMYQGNFGEYGYGNNIATNPVRIKWSKIKNEKVKNNLNTENIRIIPGISDISFEFKLVDYFGNHINYYNGATANIAIRKDNKTFSEKYDSSLKLIGKSTIPIINGNLNFPLFIIIFKHSKVQFSSVIYKYMAISI